VGNLYRHIWEYISRHRPALLGGFKDPGTFFVRTLRTDRDAEYYCRFLPEEKSALAAKVLNKVWEVSYRS